MKQNINAITASELAVLLEISTFQAQESPYLVAREVIEKAARLFSARYIIVTNDVNVNTPPLATWGFRKTDDVFIKLHQKLSNQFIYNFKTGGCLFMEFESDVSSREERFYNIFGRQVENTLHQSVILGEKKRTEGMLKLSEHSYRGLFNSITDAIYVQDVDGEFLDVNEGAVKMYGYPREYFIGKTPAVLSAPGKNDMDETLKVIKNAFNGIPQNLEWWGIRSNGEIFPKDVSLTKGTYFGKDVIIAIARDITLKKQSEAAIQASEQRYKHFFEKDIAGVYLSTIEGKLLDCNPAFVKMFGYDSREEILKIKTHLLYPEAQNRMDFISRLNNAQYLKNYEIKMVRKDGQIIHCLENVVGLMDESGRITKFQGYMIDITERKKAEETLAKFKSAIEQSSVSVIITDSKGNIEYVNPHFTALTGYTLADVYGKNPKILMSDKRKLGFYKNLCEKILLENEWRGEILNKKKNGELYWANIVISKIVNNSGNITNFIAIQEDITEKKKMIEELIEAKERAEEINRLKTNFFATMSHELRTPFVGILGYAEVLRQTLEQPEEKELVESILESSKRLTDTLNKILNISKLSFEKVELNFSQVNVIGIVKDIYKQFLKTAISKGLIFETELPQESLCIKSDGFIVREILNNLVNNAIRFTDKGFIKIKTNITNTENLDNLIIEVADSGIGIPEDKLPLIWEEFRQVSEGYNRRYEGTGLGLTISKRYAELLGGSISVQSRVNQGTQFFLKLPFDAKMVPNITPPPARKSEAQNNRQKVKHIISKEVLLVDDDNITREVIKRLLSKYYFIDAVENADKALALVKANQYDALLIDINLKSGMDGISLMKLIKDLPGYANVPRIAVTAYAMEGDKEEFLNQGFSHYLAKPFGLSELLKLLQDIFECKN